MRYLLFSCILFFSIKILAQKTLENNINASNINVIVVDANTMFKINMSTSKTKNIALKSEIDGEYSKDIVVVNRIKNDSIFISSAFQPLFINPNDKLSAHKVQSITLDISIPERKKVYIKSDIGTVDLSGNYNFLMVELNDGNCTLNTFSGDAIVNTIRGDITLETNYATVKSRSQTGVITKEDLEVGNYQLSLNSVNGDISIIKTKK